MAENTTTRVTRLAKKRAIGSQLQPANKKRVVLGEISNNQKVGKTKKVKRPVAKERVIDHTGNDPQMCGEYADDIHEYLRHMEMERKRRPLADYIEKLQRDVSVNMRSVLVDWLVQVAEEYKLLPDTLYLTVSYIDRKYEEISPPHTEDYCYITDKTLKFEMGNPTVKTYVRRFTRLAQEDYKFLSYYLAELSLLEYNCIKFLPSMVAVSVTFLAKFMLKPESHPWNLALEQVSGFKPSDLKECIEILHDLQSSRRCGNLVAIREKYSQHKFKCVSGLSSPSVIPATFFEDIKTV